jgi:hypothetical protein
MASRRIARASNISVGSDFFHEIDRLKEVEYKERIQTKFRIGLRVKSSKFIQNIFCTVEQSVSELDICEGDGVKFTKISKIYVTQSFGKQYIFVTAEVEVKKGTSSTDYLEGGFPNADEEQLPEEEAYEPPEDGV